MTSNEELLAPPYSSQPEEARPEAGPLPRKRGEIGYIEAVHGQPETHVEVQVTLPPRHPADRDEPAAAQDSDNETNAASPPPPSPGTSAESSPSNVLVKRLNAVPRIAGIWLTTLSVCIFQALALVATIAAWIISSRIVSKANSEPALGGSPVIIFLHIIFVVTLIVELVFLERTIFLLRVERYTYLHPGEILPSARLRSLPTPGIPFAPWNRPPLPTYAAALAQSGVGTGDVDDHLIAVQPPPAYGNTRGSTLVLAGYLRNSLRAQRPISEHSCASEAQESECSRNRSEQQQEGVQQREPQTVRREEGSGNEVERTIRLEETLAQLEGTSSRPDAQQRQS
ncbi:hypothetical protein AX17_005314 [Amanita inopinata Kibby_2008]|nr:hypothetical protein AX17_005314 [Amanita inopinata Kibby_2008]